MRKIITIFVVASGVIITGIFILAFLLSQGGDLVVEVPSKAEEKGEEIIKSTTRIFTPIFREEESVYGGREKVRDAAQQAENTLETSNIAYSTPEAIQLDDTVVVQLKLSPSFSIDELEEKITEPGKKEGASIPFSRRVEAHLTGSDEFFKITALGTELPREVKPGRVCEWSWAVTPTQSGTQRLFLTIDAVVAIDGKDAASYVKIFSRTIKVRVTLGQRVASFVGNNWQWLWTVGLVPLGGWLLSRVRRKRHGQNEEERTKAERVSQDQAEGLPSVRADSKFDDQEGPMLPPAPS